MLKEGGEPLPDTHLINPADALRRMRRARWLLPLLARRERRLRRTIRYSPVAIAALPAPADPVASMADAGDLLRGYA